MKYTAGNFTNTGWYVLNIKAISRFTIKPYTCYQYTICGMYIKSIDTTDESGCDVLEVAGGGAWDSDLPIVCIIMDIQNIGKG